MIKHVIVFEFLEQANEKTGLENALIAKDMLLSLKDKIPEIKSIEVGINDERADDVNHTMVLISEFESFEDLKNYQVHPEHVKVSKFIGSVRKNRACVDYEF